MASMVATARSVCSTQATPAVTAQDKGSRNKRKFRADPPTGDVSKLVSLAQSDCSSYEFSAEVAPAHEHVCVCDHSDTMKLDLGLSSSVGLSEVRPSRPREELQTDAFIDWSDITEAQLEELALSSLDLIIKSAIKKIAACGYTEEVATKAILRSGLCYVSNDIISNLADNALAVLRKGQEMEPSIYCFEDLQQLQKYLLAELVCVLREVRPFSSTGDAMWRLLISDMDLSLACAMDDLLNTFLSDGSSIGSSSTSTQPHVKVEAKSSELQLPDPSQSVPSAHSSQSGITKLKASLDHSRSVSEKEGTNSSSETTDKSFSAAVKSKSPALEEKLGSSRKAHSASTKKEYMLRQKSLHLDKSHRGYGSKGSSRSAKLSGLMLDKKLKSVSDSTTANLKKASSKISKALTVEVPQESGNDNLSGNTRPSSPVARSLQTDNIRAAVQDIQSTLRANRSLTPFPSTDPHNTELSLSLPLPPKSNSELLPVSCNNEIPYVKSLAQWVPRDKKEEAIQKLLQKATELKSQVQEWTEWANQKVMQATRRLGKDRVELKTLRQEREEVERLKKDKQNLEENTMKKLSEMENALCKASGQVERANTAVRRLEVENAGLRQEMEAAKLRAAESAANCQEVLKREKKAVMNLQSWERQKAICQEELMTEKHKASQLVQELGKAKDLEEQLEARWKQEEKATAELLTQASSIRKEREQIEALAKTKEDITKSKAETNLQKFKDEIQKLEKEISQLRLKTDSPKIAALRRGIDGSFDSKLSNKDPKQASTPYASEALTGFHGYAETGGVKRERECVMCLSEEMSVVFLPCAHQVVCTTCNELHEKQGMKDCPSCRSPIQRRISVRYANS
ncbi:hypothetical protein UlMin_009440 [Ulmus minor]